ncbi:MAG: DUF1611 domain-containing protein [Planctomycetota bacterium]
MSLGKQRLAVLTQGRTNAVSAKTAVSLLRYRPGEVVALIDTETAGQTAQEALGFGGDVPIVCSLADCGDLDALVIGVAPAGGKLPQEMRHAVLEAAHHGLMLISGLHTFLQDDPEIAAIAREHDATIFDIRKNDEREVADRLGLDDRCLRIHTVGQDCSIGKMMTSVELAMGLQRAGQDAKFVATGQTGILVAPGVNRGLAMTAEEIEDPTNGGAPIDCVVADFINGAAERLVKRNQHHDIIVLEGQATLAHPSYSSVTYGLLHGALPDGLVMCYEPGRPHMVGRPHMPLTDLKQLLKFYEHASNLEHPCKFIGVAMNSRQLGGDEAKIEAERNRVQDELGLPACDVIVHGPDTLVDATLKLKAELGKGH